MAYQVPNRLIARATILIMCLSVRAGACLCEYFMIYRHPVHIAKVVPHSRPTDMSDQPCI